MVRLKALGLRLAEALVGMVVSVLPDRIRVIVSERAPSVRPLVYSKTRVLLHVDSWIELKVRLKSATREPDTVRWIETHFRDGDVFYDIGANVGAYSLITAKLYGGRVRVCAFEPSALNFAQLVRNLALNECGDTVTPLPIALAESTQPLVFNYRNVTRGAALHSLGDAAGEHGEAFVPALRQHLLAYSLDALVPHYHLPDPNHIKIDVDGSEERILTGATATLSRQGLKSVLIEASGDTASNERLRVLLVAAGLRFAERHDMPGGFSNWLFLREPHATEHHD